MDMLCETGLDLMLLNVPLMSGILQVKSRKYLPVNNANKQLKYALYLNLIQYLKNNDF